MPWIASDDYATSGFFNPYIRYYTRLFCLSPSPDTVTILASFSSMSQSLIHYLVKVFSIHLHRQHFKHLPNLFLCFPLYLVSELEYRIPQVRFHFFIVSPSLVSSLFKYSWCLFFGLRERKMLLRALSDTIALPTVPWRINPQVKPYSDVMMNHANCFHKIKPIVIAHLFSYFWKLDLLKHSCYFMGYTDSYDAALTTSNLSSRGVSEFNETQQDIIGLWISRERNPVVARMRTCLSVGENPLDCELSWGRRICAKYHSATESMEACPIPEILACSTFTMNLLSSRVSNVNVNMPSKMKYVSMIELHFAGPTFADVIRVERRNSFTTRTIPSIKQWNYFKIAACYSALQRVHQLGSLAIRHNNLCPQNFRLGPPCFPSTTVVKIQNLGCATSALSTTVYKRLYRTNPWFRSPELVLNISCGPVATCDLNATNTLGRASDAWSTGLSLTCFLLGCDVEIECRDIEALQYDVKGTRWKRHPRDWVHDVRGRLFGNKRTIYVDSLMQRLAAALFDLLVVPEFFNRNLPLAVNLFQTNSVHYQKRCTVTL